MQDEDRMIEIEIKLTRQEDLLDALNQTVYRQQKELASLHTLVQDLTRQMREMLQKQDGQGRSLADERPPHY
ncbi:SlyX family protein [Massilia sp. W12]|uniref:SlyX family protein n=1 Tax=Massilia sp. W12 TaxID=3126507 RepID=UPI0030D5EE3C